MDRNGVAHGMLNSGREKSGGLTRWIACDIIPPLKASALRSPNGLETEGTVSTMPARNSSKSLRSCSQPTIHI